MLIPKDNQSDRSLFGWRVRSDLALPELPAWCGDDRGPDLRIELGEVPPLGDEALAFSPAVQIAGDVLRFEIPAVARYLVTGGERVTIEPVMAPDSTDVRVFLFGTVLSVLCYRRGLVPLHAAALEVGGRALLLAGDSGIGKSTLAAQLLKRGCRVLSDDVVALDISDPHAPLVRPSFPRIKLWEDATDRLQLSTEGLEQARVELRKFLVPVGDSFQAEPLPPAHLVLLQRARLPADAGLTRLTGVAAVTRYDAVHRWRLGIALGRQPLIFSALAALLRVAPMTELRRVDDAERLPELADQVLALVERA